MSARGQANPVRSACFKVNSLRAAFCFRRQLEIVYLLFWQVRGRGSSRFRRLFLALYESCLSKDIKVKQNAKSATKGPTCLVRCNKNRGINAHSILKLAVLEAESGVQRTPEEDDGAILRSTMSNRCRLL